MTPAMSGATPSDSGLASGLVNMSMEVDGAIGVFVLRSEPSPAAAGAQERGQAGREPAYSESN